MFRVESNLRYFFIIISIFTHFEHFAQYMFYTRGICLLVFFQKKIPVNKKHSLCTTFCTFILLSLFSFFHFLIFSEKLLKERSDCVVVQFIHFILT